MATERPTKDITATVKSKTQKEGQKGPFWQLELVEQGQTQAYRWTLFDFKAGQDVGINQQWMFRVFTPPNPRGGVFRNIDSVLGLAEAPKGTTPLPPPVLAGGMKVIRYGRTFNLGNYESSRMEIEQDFPIDMPDRDCFGILHKRLAEARAALTPKAQNAPGDTTADEEGGDPY